MKILIDADGCPVTELAVKAAKEHRIPCLIICDTAHEIQRSGAQTLVIDKGADSVDFAIANRIQAGDLVITQDYGLASMCLARRARVLHQDGWEYTEDNIQALLFQRHESRKYRASGGRIRGPAKRQAEQNRSFAEALERLLNHTSFQG